MKTLNIKTILITTLVYATGLIVYIGQIAFNGFVVMKLWQWLIIPTFDLPELNLWQAIGLSLMLLILSRSKTLLKEEYEQSVWVRLRFNLTENAILLGLGWIISFLL